MCRSLRSKRLILSAVVAGLTLVSCRAPFRTNVADFRGAARPSFYEGESLNLQVGWDAKHDNGKQVGCTIVDTYTGISEWTGTAEIPIVLPGSLKTLDFDPPLPANGQLGLKPGEYEWACDLDEWTVARTQFDIRYQ